MNERKPANLSDYVKEFCEKKPKETYYKKLMREMTPERMSLILVNIFTVEYDYDKVFTDEFISLNDYTPYGQERCMEILAKLNSPVED